MMEDAMTTMNFKTIPEALAAVAGAEHLDDAYGIFPVGDAPKIEDGTHLVIEEPATELVVLWGRAYGKAPAPLGVETLNPDNREEAHYIAALNRHAHERYIQTRTEQIMRRIASAIGERAAIQAGRLMLDGEAARYLDIREDYDRVGSWRSRPSGKISVTVGDYGNKRRFPQRKDGTHNYPEIAAELVRANDAGRARGRAYAQRDANYAAVRSLRDEVGYEAGWSIEATESAEKPVKASRSFAITGTAEEVRAFMRRIDEMLKGAS